MFSTVLMAAVASHDDEGAAVATAGAPASPADLNVATFNVLHGIFCAAGTDFCAAPLRTQMLVAALQDAGCPEIVVLQEIGPRQKELVPPAATTMCDGRYRAIWHPGPPAMAQVMVLTSLPVVEEGHLDLAHVPWEALWARLRSPLGEVEVVGAHFASGFNNPPCTAAGCPAVCDVGIATNECHAVEAVHFQAGRPPSALQIVAGDLNASPDTATLRTLTGSGWRDLWLEAGRPECTRSTPSGCTAGRPRPETAFDGLDSDEGRHRRRIDYVLAKPGSGCHLRAGADTISSTPASDPIGGLYWPSDHAGVVTGISC
jgi:endonuclease/exonuclease/phosphatase family metal-dependent hydrolase